MDRKIQVAVLPKWTAAPFPTGMWLIPVGVWVDGKRITEAS